MLQIILAGVGGQGILLASKILARAALDSDCNVKTAETIGMAQRGGSVVSHLRISEPGEEIFSSMIGEQSADMILAFEPGEALRSIHLLSTKGTVVASNIGVCPTMTSDKEVIYKLDEIDAELMRLADCGRIKDYKKFDAQAQLAELGSTKCLNTLILGAAVDAGILPFSTDQLVDAMKKLVKPAFAELNERALRMGL